MKKLNFYSLLLSLIFLSGCAVGPLVVHETGRTVGNSKNEFVGGFGRAGAVFKWSHGLSDNLDFGLQIESLSIGVRAKYAFINGRDNGWSLAGAAGVGSSIGGSHYYGDLIASYLAGSWEPYGTFRAVHVKNDPEDFRDQNTGDLVFHIDKIEYNYGQAVLGTRYWFNSRWLLSLEASTLFSMTSDVKMDDNLLIGAAVGCRF